MTNYGTIRCDECDQDLTDGIQVYPTPGEVLCEQCNFRIKDEA